MRIKNVIKRISIFFLVFVLLFLCVFFSFNRGKEVKAEPVSIGLGIGALISFLTASGVALSFNNMSKPELVNNFQNYADEFSNDTGAQSIQDLENTKNAFNYYYNDQAGEAMVSVSTDVSNWMNRFKNWFVQKFALTDSGETVLVNSNVLDLPDGKYPYYPDRSVFTNGVVPISLVPIVTGVTDIPITDSFSARITVGEPYEYYGRRIQISIQGYNPNTDTLSGNFTHIYGADQAGNFDYIKVYFGNYNGNITISMAPDDFGDYTVWNYGYFTSIAVSSLETSSIGMSGALTDGYSDFEQALSDAQSDAGEAGQVAVGAGEVEVDKPYTKEKINDAILDNALTNVGTGTLVGGYTDDKEVEEENDVVKAPTGAEIGSNVVLVNGLEDFFPFCIPFDLYEIINYLNVPAEAPKFNWKMSFANRFDDYDILIDLTPYNTVAAVFRTMIIIVFLIFLTLKTRDLIRG